MIAINCPNGVRHERLKLQGHSDESIKKIDDKEYEESFDFSRVDSIASPNTKRCIEMADIFIDNTPGSDHHVEICKDIILDGDLRYVLKKQLARYLVLIQHPGLINPSRDERMMQIAYTAKLNSGCLSRQVGAVVTNADGAPKAIGWNSTPENQVACILRDLRHLRSGNDPAAYSEYEKNNEKFKFITNNQPEDIEQKLAKQGLPCCYCFKDIQYLVDKKVKRIGAGKNPANIRSLHAEENAFLQVSKYGGEGIKGGKLYVTASPCDLCARKAYQLGISEIYYIDPYPGIAVDNVIKAGRDEHRPAVFLFSGAVGSAYSKLYEPLVPYKDEIEAYTPESTEKDIGLSIPIDSLKTIERAAESQGVDRESFIIEAALQHANAKLNSK